MIDKDYIRKIVDCCNQNPVFQVGIFVKSRDSIFTICGQINAECGKCGCEIVINERYGKVRFDNGSIISICIAEECNIRSRRYNVAMIEKDVRPYIVYDYIAPWVTLKRSEVDIQGLIWV